MRKVNKKVVEDTWCLERKKKKPISNSANPSLYPAIIFIYKTNKAFDMVFSEVRAIIWVWISWLNFLFFFMKNKIEGKK